MTENKAITYSLLAHVRNSGTLMKGPIDPFVPLIKRALYKLNSQGILSGRSIKEIHDIASKLYAIDFPLPVLNTILQQIAKEVNKDEINFQIFNDGAFILRNFYFEDFEEKIQTSKREVETLEKLYVDFLKVVNVEVKEKTTIFDFIDKNKISLSKYLANSHHNNGQDFTIEAKFVDYFRKIPDVFEIIRNIYLGSIISGYLEYRTEEISNEIELVFDTNFIISLIDLNTPESTHTCNKLIEIGKKLGYKFTVLSDTVEETKSLILKKAEFFSSSVLSKRINPEDIYNACERRKLNKNDLERIVDNIEETLNHFGIFVLPNTEKYKNLAKFSSEYENYKKYRSSHYAALHDATALYYIRDKRRRKIKEFEKVNCWFVNNSITHDTEEPKDSFINSTEFQPEIIRVDELLNILWLASPTLSNSLNTDELVDIGLSSVVAFTLNSSLPKASIIKELDENIQKYKGDKITDKDILLISSRIAHRQLRNISELNTLANKDEHAFANRIKEEAQKQQKEEDERIQKLDNLFQKFERNIAHLDKEKQNIKIKKEELDTAIKTTTETSAEKDNLIEILQGQIKNIENKQKGEERRQLQNEINRYIDNEVAKWQQKIKQELFAWFAGLVIAILAVLWKSEWKINSAISKMQELKADFFIGNVIVLIVFIFTSITVKKWYDRHHNYSNIENYKKNINLPDYLNRKDSLSDTF